jgi:hypothetical protein
MWHILIKEYFHPYKEEKFDTYDNINETLKTLLLQIK